MMSYDAKSFFVLMLEKNTLLFSVFLLTICVVGRPNRLHNKWMTACHFAGGVKNTPEMSYLKNGLVVGG